MFLIGTQLIRGQGGRTKKKDVVEDFRSPFVLLCLTVRIENEPTRGSSDSPV